MDVVAPPQPAEPAMRPVVQLRTKRRPFTTRVTLPPLEALGNPNALVLSALVLFLVGFGLVMVLSASSVEEGVAGNPYGAFVTQGIAAFLGTGAMLVVSRARPTLLLRAAPVVFGAAILLQVLTVLTPLGVEVNGNRNWVRIAGMSVQPSEFVKLGLILVLGAFFTRRPAERIALRGLAPVLLHTGAALVAVYLGHDLGTCLIIALIAMAGLFFAGVRLPVLGVLVAGAVPVVWLLARGDGSRVSRLASWGSSCTDLLGTCWQTKQAEWALANGGLFGVGIGNSVSKWFWLPEADNDFILAVIGEETGLLGLLVLIGCFLAIAVVSLRIITGTGDRFTRAATGMTMTWLVGQAFANIAVVLGLVPVFGVPLPFVSAGGSSMAANLLAVGCVMALGNAAGAARTQPAEAHPEHPAGRARPTGPRPVPVRAVAQVPAGAPARRLPGRAPWVRRPAGRPGARP